MRKRVLEWTDPLATLAAAEKASGVEYLRQVASGSVALPPMAHVMNLEIVSVERGSVVFAGTPGEEHYNPHGTVHGGWAATLFDTALGCSVHSTLDAGFGYTTLDLHVNYVRPITHATGRMLCKASVLHDGKRIATAQAQLVDESGVLYGHATTTCLIFPRRTK